MKCEACGQVLKGIQSISALHGGPRDQAELYCDNIACAKFNLIAWPKAKDLR